VNVCDFGKLFTVNHKDVCVCVWRTRLNHFKQIKNIFKLFNLLKSRLWCVLYPRDQFLINDITDTLLSSCWLSQIKLIMFLQAAVSPTKWINSAKAQTMYKLFLGKNVIQPTRNLAWSKRFLLERLWNGRHRHTPFPRHPCEVLGEFLLVNWCHRPISLKTTVSHIARPHRMRTTVYVCPSTYYSAILMCYKQIWIELQVSI